MLADIFHTYVDSGRKRLTRFGKPEEGSGNQEALVRLHGGHAGHNDAKGDGQYWDCNAWLTSTPRVAPIRRNGLQIFGPRILHIMFAGLCSLDTSESRTDLGGLGHTLKH